MEKFAQQGLDTTRLKPNWFRCVDDTLVVRNHVRDEFDKFLCHLNNIHPNIQFTMEIEKEHVLPSLDVSVCK